MEMFVSDIEREFAAELLRIEGVTGDKPIVALSPGSTVVAKQWFPERYAALSDCLIANGMDVLIVGAKSERAMIDEVIGKSKARAIDISGRTKIGQLAAVFEKCSVVVSNDTGPLHMAASMDTPVVAIYGPTSPHIVGPYNAESIIFWECPECSPCGYKKDCKRDCMDVVTVDMVFNAAAELAALRRDIK
jgi:ADP-heptose:LPS heptosyltransferase